jgi:hypothetical protein
VFLDRTPVVIKHVTPADWAMVVSGGVSHLGRLWRAGVFDRFLAAAVQRRSTTR